MTRKHGRRKIADFRPSSPICPERQTERRMMTADRCALPLFPATKRDAARCGIPAYEAPMSLRSDPIVLFCLWRDPDDLSPLGIAALCYPGSEGRRRSGALVIGLRSMALVQSSCEAVPLLEAASALRRFGSFCGKARAWGAGQDIAALALLRSASALAPSPHSGGFLDICAQPCLRVWADRLCAQMITTSEAGLCALRHLASDIRSQARIAHPFPYHTPFQ